jgi:ABC-2 type transport system permease protein
MNNMMWLIRREFWENKAIWLLPAVISGFMIIASIFGGVHVGPNEIHLGPGSSVPESRMIGGMALFAFSAIFVALMSIYSAWYLLDCLYADRKDRSILFWKSLPLTDAETVLSKLSVGLLVIPLVYFAIADLTTLALAFVISIRASSWVGTALWQPDVWLQLQVLWLFLIVTLAVWLLPVAGWLMLVSATATRAVVLWSILPLLGLYLGERWVFGTHVIGNLLSDRLVTGYAQRAFSGSGSESGLWGAIAREGSAHAGFGTADSVWRFLDPVGFFASPATWIGAAIGAALIAATIQVRARRSEI